MAPPSPNCTVQCHTNQPQPLQCNHLTNKMNIAIISNSAPNSLKIQFTNFEVVQKLNPTFRSQSFTLPLTIATNTQIQTSFSATCLKNTTTKCTLVPKSSSWTNPFGDDIPSNLSQGEQDTFKTRQIPCLSPLMITALTKISIQKWPNSQSEPGSACIFTSCIYANLSQSLAI